MGAVEAMHVVLLGDSILDNAAYTSGGPDVATQLAELLGSGGRVTLLAVDGSVMDDLPDQLRRVPEDATHLVLSVGGNDALEASEVLNEGVGSVAEALGRLQRVLARFEAGYDAALDGVTGLGKPTGVLTVYNGWFSPREARILTTAVRLFDDVIIGCATDRGLPVIDLRRVCASPEDYANPIEPNAVGGLKIAREVLAWIRERPETGPEVRPARRGRRGTRGRTADPSDPGRGGGLPSGAETPRSRG